MATACRAGLQHPPGRRSRLVPPARRRVLDLRARRTPRHAAGDRDRGQPACVDAQRSDPAFEVLASAPVAGPRTELRKPDGFDVHMLGSEHPTEPSRLGGQRALRSWNAQQGGVAAGLPAPHGFDRHPVFAAVERPRVAHTVADDVCDVAGRQHEVVADEVPRSDHALGRARRPHLHDARLVRHGANLRRSATWDAWIACCRRARGIGFRPESSAWRSGSA